MIPHLNLEPGNPNHKEKVSKWQISNNPFHGDIDLPLDSSKMVKSPNLEQKFSERLDSPSNSSKQRKFSSLFEFFRNLNLQASSSARSDKIKITYLKSNKTRLKSTQNITILSKEVCLSFDRALSMKRRKHKNSIAFAMQEESFKKNCLKLSTFIIFKILLPISFFTCLCMGQIYLHEAINGFCFQPICQCKDFSIFLYTIVYDLLKLNSVFITFFYYGLVFINQDFYKKKRMKALFFIVNVAFLIPIYIYFYPKRNEKILQSVRASCLAIICIVSIIYTLVLGILNRDFNKEFFKRILITIFLSGLICLHTFYLKPVGQIFILDLFKTKIDYKIGLSLFKVCLLVYNILYGMLSNRFLFYYYEKVVANDKINCLNLIIVYLEFVFVDVYSVKSLNILTTELNDFSSMISFFAYFYSLICLYSGTEFICKFLEKIKAFFFKGELKSPTIQSKSFNKLKNGTILQICYIIIARMISFKALPTFFSITKNEIYKDCSLHENHSSFQINIENLVYLIIIHVFLILMSSLYMGKKKKNLFDLRTPNFGYIMNFFMFTMFFQNADYSIQIYKSFIESY